VSNAVYAPDLPCGLCGIVFNDHSGLVHPFVGPNQDPGAAVNPPNKRKKQETTTPRVIVAPMPDLVLRHALVKKGLLTPEDLEAAERELTLGISSSPGQTNGVFADPDTSGGDSSDRSRSSTE
jgi:hypothetical protein